MRFVWDERKERENRRKHGLSFENAIRAFDDPFALSLQDRLVGGEERWQTLGLAAGLVVLLVAHTYYEEQGEEIIRVISARKATARERKFYEANRAAIGS